MPIVLEGFRSRKGGKVAKEIMRPYSIEDVGDEQEALAQLLGRAPTAYDGLPRVDDEITIDEIGNRLFQATVMYRAKEAEDVGKVDEGTANPDDDNLNASFTTLGATTHITQCIEQIDYGPEAAPDIRLSRAINVTRDGVDGVDIVVGKLEITKQIRKTVVTNFYMNLLADLTGTVNDGPIFGRKKGEVLFSGASGSRGPDNEWLIDLNFVLSKNAENIKVTNEITVATKLGHDYLWVMYKKDEKDNRLVETADVVFVAQVYQFADLNQIFRA